MDRKCLKGIELTPKKLRRIFRWVKNKKFSIEITNEYFGSRGTNIDRWEGEISHFTVERNGSDFKATVSLNSGQTASIWFNSSYIFAIKFRPDILLIYEEYSMPQHAFRIKAKSA